MSLNRQEDKKQETPIDSFLFLLVTEPASNWATTTCTSPLGGRGRLDDWLVHLFGRVRDLLLFAEHGGPCLYS